ncbi:MAG: hypothetical protein KAX15_02275, partial [Candidatus Omnitrophica bacterium]|nr:hypothetical protein [Candidatus Omnitrophota bacterium]
MGLRLLGKFWEWYVGLGNVGGVNLEDPPVEDDPPEDPPVDDPPADPPVDSDPPEDNDPPQDPPSDDPPETVPYSRLKEQSDQLKEVRKQAEASEKRADELERRIAENEQKSKRKTKEEIDDWYQADPVAAATALAEDKAYAIIDAQEYKTDVIEELAEGNKDFVPFEKEVKRKLR